MEKKQKPPFPEAARIISQNAGFTDTATLEDSVYRQVFGLENNLKENTHARIAETRLRNFERYVPLVQKYLSRPISPIAQTAYQVERCQEIDPDLSTMPTGDQLLETIEAYMTALIEDPESARELIHLIKKQARASTNFNIEEMRDAQARGDVLKTDVIIVGSSLNALPLIKMLSPFLNIKVVSNDLPSEPWYSRQLFLNSSSDGTREGSPLPLVGDATPIGGPKGDGPTLAKLDDTASKVIACDSPEAPYRKYKAGPKVGTVIGAQLATTMDIEKDFIQADVVVEGTDFDQNGDGLNTITLRTRAGEIFQYKAEKVIFATGPGNEEVRLADINNAKVCTKLLDVSKAQIRTIEDKLVRQEAMGIPLTKFDLRLPKFADFTLLCEHFRIWDEFYDRDPQLYPLKEVLDADNEIGIIGNGDTERILAEIFDRMRGPASAYPPEGISPEDSPHIVAYGIDAQTSEEYDQKNRRRYNGALASGNVQPAPRAQNIKLSSGQRMWSIKDEQGDLREHDYIFTATGLNKKPLADRLGNYTIETILDEEGIPVGTGDIRAGVFIAGPASRLTAAELAPEIKTILQVLEVPENTVAAWVWGPLCARLGLTVLDELNDVAYLNELKKRRVFPSINLPGFSKIQQQAA